MPESKRTKATGFVITALFACVESGQAPAEQTLDRVFYFTHTETPQNFQEVTNIVRAMADIQHASVDPANKNLALRGTASQLVVAEWLLNEIDRPVPAPPVSQVPVTHEFRDAGGRDEVVRVFNLTNPGTPQSFQEITNLIRSMTDMQRVFPYSARKVLVVRGSADQVAMAEWLLKELDRPDNGQPPAPESPDMRELRVTPNIIQVVRVFYFTHNQTAQDVQAITNQIRTATHVQRLYPYHAQHALASRGTAEEIAGVARLVKELDKPIAR